ncbi:hypothetical protein ACFW04_000039 [Cataglyphis niger]
MLTNATANEMKNELWWSIYAWWTCVLVCKMMLLTWYTGQIRYRKQVKFSKIRNIFLFMSISLLLLNQFNVIEYMKIIKKVIIYQILKNFIMYINNVLINVTLDLIFSALN